MPYELPADGRADRRGAVLRWLTFAILAVLVAALTYVAYAGFVGSAQAVDPPNRSRDCRTPRIAFGWEYEAINYDQSADARLEDLEDPTQCEVEPERAGDEVVTPDGVGLAGWYIPAGNGPGPAAPTIVLAHGHATNKSEMLSRAEVLHRTYNLLLFDFRGHGQSQDAPSTVGLREQEDLRTMIDWLETTKQPRTIGVLGVSMGSAAAINEAAGDQRVRALVMDSTHATLASAIQARLDRAGFPLSMPAAWAVLFGGLIRTGEDMSAADPIQAVERYGGRPLLIVAGRADDAIGPTDTDDLVAAAREGGARVELQVCESAGHGGTLGGCGDEYRDWVLGFFADALAR
ncbi:MAG TPA: alpha/beta hydrolase [Candidatus Limnocylindria bacterium]|nr:alpha/beta hydrolase [Candidatus Limnocylindria bacterium]